MVKSAACCEFGHIYWKNPYWETSLILQWIITMNVYLSTIIRQRTTMMIINWEELLNQENIPLSYIISFNLFEATDTFSAPWKYQKTRGFRMFSGSKKGNSSLKWVNSAISLNIVFQVFFNKFIKKFIICISKTKYLQKQKKWNQSFVCILKRLIPVK